MDTWVFPVPPQTAVFTVKSIFDGSSPIRFASYDTDEHWQFLDGSSPKTSEALMVSLQEVLALDPSIVQLANMRPGEFATRSDLSSPWIFSTHQESVARGIDIICDQTLSPALLKQILESFFIGETFEFWEMSKPVPPTNTFRLDIEDHPYPLTVALDFLNETPLNKIYEFCRFLSEKAQMSCLCPYLPDEDPNNPYQSLLFEKGITYLADDSEFESHQSIKKIKRLDNF